MSILLDIDPLTGAIETFDFDQATGTSIITRTENVDTILDLNAQSYNEGKGSGASWRGEDNDFWLVARVPLTVMHEWMIEFNAPRAPADRLVDPFDTRNEEWDKFIQCKLDSGDNRKLKAAPVAWR